MRKVLSAVLVCVCVLSYMLIYAVSISDGLAPLLRLHIIAQSDSLRDQEIKLGVRDYISCGLKDCTQPPYSAEYLPKCEQLANERLAQLGADYKAHAALERVYIPKKKYKNITLPSGRYNAVRVVLGSGSGQNWWCVAYPPLCFTESVSGELSAQGKEILKEKLTEEAYELITSENEYRFWIVDFVGRLMG